MSRQRNYADEYRKRNERAVAEGYHSYGAKRWALKRGYADLQKYPSWKDTLSHKPKGYHDIPHLADLFRRGLLKVGSPATDDAKAARREFLAIMTVWNVRPDLTTQQRIAQRATEMANDPNFGLKTFAAGSDFNWREWREDYETVKAGIAA